MQSSFGPNSQSPDKKPSERLVLNPLRTELLHSPKSTKLFKLTTTSVLSARDLVFPRLVPAQTTTFRQLTPTWGVLQGSCLEWQMEFSTTVLPDSVIALPQLKAWLPLWVASVTWFLTSTSHGMPLREWCSFKTPQLLFLASTQPAKWTNWLPAWMALLLLKGSQLWLQEAAPRFWLSDHNSCHHGKIQRHHHSLLARRSASSSPVLPTSQSEPNQMTIDSHILLSWNFQTANTRLLDQKSDSMSGNKRRRF